jgi:Ca-activated chloride channel family protein
MRIATMPEAEAAHIAAPVPDSGIGVLKTERGNLPLETLDVKARITGLVVDVDLTQGFRNDGPDPLEATYVFPLPDRAAVTGMTMTADDRVVEAQLQERGHARQVYDQAIAAGQRASIAEEERPDVFTMRVGNILPGERVTVALRLTGPLSYEDGEATFRFPLVVAPRYIPGAPLAGGSVGDGYALDTDAVPDASRITPPVLLPGFPNPLRLSIEVDIDPAGLSLGDVRSSLHQVSTADGHLSIRPGERADRDFVLRLVYGADSALSISPDAEGDESTFRFTVLPPAPDGLAKPRDVVLLLDRSGSMGGWKMVAARRAAARIVDTLGADDRFAVLAFDHEVETPPTLGDGLVQATDRHRFRAVEHLSRMDARGGTEVLEPLRRGLRLLTDSGSRDRVLVLVTDGQVGNEDQVLRETSGSLAGVRVHTVGIDRAVNAGFLGRLAIAGGGRCELVESEDRLDEAMERIHRRIGSPVVTGVTLESNNLSLISPARLPDIFPGVPFVVAGRLAGDPRELTLKGTTRDGKPWSASASPQTVEGPATTWTWARAHLRDLEDMYVSQSVGDLGALERQITETSLRFGMLCRFTAFVAVDARVVNEGGHQRRVVQPVESPSGWDMFGAAEVATDRGVFLKQSAVAPVGMPPAAAPMSAPMMPPPAPMPGQPPVPSRPMPFASGMAAGGGGAAGGMMRLPRGRTSSRMPRPVTPEVRAPEPGIDLGELIAREVSRLREAVGRPAYERRELLEDLGSRLAALGDKVLLALADELKPDAIARRPLEELWQHVLRTLESFGRPSSEKASPPPVRSAFWKRRG